MVAGGAATLTGGGATNITGGGTLQLNSASTRVVGASFSVLSPSFKVAMIPMLGAS
jgi:hypothetical protein